jgi:hypothetical protein
MLLLKESDKAKFIEDVKEVCRWESVFNEETGQKRKAQSLSYVLQHLRDKGWRGVSNAQPDDFYDLGFDVLVSDENPNQMRWTTPGKWKEDRGYKKVKLGKYHFWIAQKED